MKLESAFNAATTADKTNGLSDADLPQHLVATGQSGLPQAEILQEALERLKERGLIEEAYLRGSFGRGHGDDQSDIDLFVVVDPENLKTVYETVNAYLEEKGGVITSCYDRLVEDYGGIGFMFVAKNAKHNTSYQFDLYMAIKGVAPLSDFTIKPRIFSRDPDYQWMKEYGAPRDPEALPADAKAFIENHTKGQDIGDRLELLMQEQLLNLYVTSKHMKRGQTSRVMLDNQSITATAIEMLQALTDYTSTGYTSLYLGNEVVEFARAHGDAEMVAAANKLESFFEQPINRQKLRDVLDYCKDVLQQSYPERYERQKDAIAYFEKKVLAEPKSAPVTKRGAAPR